jgi:hypothetical protein
MKTCIALTFVLCLLTSGCSAPADGSNASKRSVKAESNTLTPEMEQLRAVGTTQE